MPNQHTDAESALKKLGQRLRTGHAKQHPVSDKSLETVRGAVREQWELEQKPKVTKKPTPSKNRQPKPPEPEQEP